MRRLLRHWKLWLLLLAALWIWRALHPSLPDRFVLAIEPEGTIVEQIAPPQIPWSFVDAEQTDLFAILRALNAAAEDKRVVQILFRLDRLEHASPAAIEEIARAIQKARRAGKHIVADGIRFSQPAYLIAAACDEIVLDPMGVVELTGFALQRWYLKDFLQRLGLTAHIVRAGEYKTFGEELVRNEMSPQERQQAAELVRDAMDWMFGYLARHRPRLRLDRARFDAIVQTLPERVRSAGGFAAFAKAIGLVDRLEAPHRFEAQRIQEPIVSVEEYLDDLPRWATVMDIGLIVASGPIVDGEGSAGEIGAETLVELIEQAAEDDRIRALVLRLDTPGGSATASERIRQAILALRRDKPVVVSMGAACASGGYWIASAADAIVAEAATITGSIGVVGVLFDAAKLLARLGIHPDGVAASPLAGQPRIDTPPPDLLVRAWQAEVEAAYRRFLRVVSEGRKIPMERLRELAAGRVYSGARAKRLGLVDAIGGLDRALAKAASLARVSRWGVRRIEKKKGILERIWQAIAERIEFAPEAQRALSQPLRMRLWAWDGAHLVP